MLDKEENNVYLVLRNMYNVYTTILTDFKI